MAQKGITVLLAEIIAKVFQNSNKSVTGQDVQDVMVDMTDSLNQATYSASIAYNVGQSIIFNDIGIKKLYECITDTAAGESPATTPAKWTPITGGATGSSDIKIAKAEILYTNISQTTIITLPANAVIWNIGIEVTTLFNGSGDDFLDVGITGTADRYLNDSDLSSVYFEQTTGSANNVEISPNATYFPSFIVSDKMTGSTNITFQYVPSVADAAQGAAYVYIHYSLH